jgi:glycosyltransferase involved in cell wall biosynthesis
MPSPVPVPEPTLRASWVIPVRDGGAWLREAVASALADSGPLDEVLVVDDGSAQDPGPSLPGDPRLRLLRGPRSGLVAALERGRREARGRFLARLDADDRSLPGRIAAEVACLEDRPEVAAVGGGGVWIGEPEGAGMRRYLEWVNGVEDPGAALLVESPLLHPSVLVRASALEAVGGWREGDFPEDYDLWLRLVRAGFALARVPGPVVALRDHGGRLTRTDPRYRDEAFLALKREHLARTLLAQRRKVAVWGGRRHGRRWARWMLAGGHHLEALIDLGPPRSWKGVPVRPPVAATDLAAELLFVAVGRPGAREEIRRILREARPDLVEGDRLWFLR